MAAGALTAGRHGATTVPATAGAHCAGSGCEHDDHTAGVPHLLAGPRHRRERARHLPGAQPSRRSTPSTRRTARP